MAIDRLAALRAQRQTGTSSTPAQDGGYELNPVGTPPHIVGENGTGDNFYDQISSVQELIEQFNANIARISELHSRSLNVVDGSGQQALAALDDQVAQTRDLGNHIKKTIEAIKKQPVPRGQESRKNQVTRVAKQFVTALQAYTQVEKDYRQKQRQRVERQLKIVKPDATAEEVAAVVNDSQGSGEQVFANALSNTSRYGESRVAYREVQSRHEDIKKIEQTLEEVAQLINDMSVLVQQQDETIDYIENQTGVTEREAQKGVDQIDKAKEIARRTRRKRIILFWLVVLLLCIVGGIIAGVIVSNNNKKK